MSQVRDIMRCERNRSTHADHSVSTLAASMNNPTSSRVVPLDRSRKIHNLNSCRFKFSDGPLFTKVGVLQLRVEHFQWFIRERCSTDIERRKNVHRQQVFKCAV